MTADREYLTVEECERIEALLAKASPEPWRVSDDGPDLYIAGVVAWLSEGVCVSADLAAGREAADADLIVSLRNASPRLLAAATEYARMREALRSLCPRCGDTPDTTLYHEGVDDDGDPWGVEHFDFWCASGCGRWTVPIAARMREAREEGEE